MLLCSNKKSIIILILPPPWNFHFPPFPFPSCKIFKFMNLFIYFFKGVGNLPYFVLSNPPLLKFLPFPLSSPSKKRRRKLWIWECQNKSFPLYRSWSYSSKCIFFLSPALFSLCRFYYNNNYHKSLSKLLT